MDRLNYNVGIDVGQNSIGFCAIELDKSDNPIRFLNLGVYRHDAGVDPNEQKYATTRLAVSGVARRTRRLIRRRRERLKKLDAFIEKMGWPIIDLEKIPDPYYPWVVRAQLADEFISDDVERFAKLSVALRHMARHRGWRSPWTSVESLKVEQEDSEQFTRLKDNIQAVLSQYDVELPDDCTCGQAVNLFLDYDPDRKLRGKERSITRKGSLKEPIEAVMSEKLMQSDNANELRRIAEVQGIEKDTLNQIIQVVFAAKSPKGSAAKRAGKDVLPGQEKLFRAEKSHLAFQKYRIVSVVANLRIVDAKTGEITPLSAEQKAIVVDYLYNYSKKESPTWIDVADQLGVPRELLYGTAKEGPDGELPSALPPINVTNQVMSTCSIAPIKKWWKQADETEKSALIELLSYSTDDYEDSPAHDKAERLLASLSDEDNQKLDSLHLPAGRAAYSVDSLRRLTSAMLENDLDLFEARKAEFGVPNDWKPPAEEVGAPVGNPAVDRVLKQVNRWLLAAQAAWGVPAKINIEHVRDGFKSEKMVREINRLNKRRFEAKSAVKDDIRKLIGTEGQIHDSDINRYRALQRQGGQCLYCGKDITFQTCEMDHIVPRKGIGSTNTRENLVAVCRQCNHDKSNQLFSVWASQTNIPGVSVKEAIERVEFWVQDSEMSSVDFRRLKQAVIARLKRKNEDPEMDERSMESVAWMARELAHRIAYWYPQTDVKVYRGSITAAARKAAGFENKVNFIGGKGKTRLDRRHHAMDAATIAMMRPKVAQVLVQRGNLRASQRATGQEETWKQFYGDKNDPYAIEIFQQWLDRMEKVVDMFNDAIESDAIPVWSSLRLRLGNSKVHADSVEELDAKEVGSEWTMEDIDRASTPALWCALTRLPDFEWKKGLPADPNRKIVVNGTHYQGTDEVKVFKTKAASLKVREGSVAIGGSIHHARVYRIQGKNKPSYAMVRVFNTDLQKFVNQDLFTAELPPQSMSMRKAPMKLREALANGTAEYLGWIVVGDELHLTIPENIGGQVGILIQTYPNTNHWVIAGFMSETKLRVRPLLIAGEGLNDNADKSIDIILNGGGWLPEINVVFSKCEPVIIRRDSLGRIRRTSNSNLPVSWGL